MTCYLCRDCGTGLIPYQRSRLLWCSRCQKKRRVPTHPALVITRRPVSP